MPGRPPPPTSAPQPPAVWAQAARGAGVVVTVLAVVLAGLVGCVPGGAPAPARPAATPSATPSPPPVLAAPALAILPDAAGLPATGRNDRLTAAEYAASGSDQVIELDRVSAWGWSAGSSRTWGAGGRRVSVIVVLSDRPEGAARAFGDWAAAAATGPLRSAACPDAVAGLDDCRLAQAGSRTLVVGRLDAEVFRLEAVDVDAVPLAAAQASRLRAG